MDVKCIILLLVIYVNTIDCYYLYRYTSHNGRPVYSDSDSIEYVYSVPNSNITLRCENSSDSLIWAKQGFSITYNYRKMKLSQLHRLYWEYIPNSKQTIDVNGTYELTINDVNNKRDDRTYICSGDETMEVQKTFILNVFNSPFNNYDETINMQINNGTILNCGIDVTDYRLEFFRWIYFPIRNDPTVYIFISLDELIVSDERANYRLIGNCDLQLINDNNPGLYVFRASFNNRYSREIRMKYYKLSS